jgi:hypothetical protein
LRSQTVISNPSRGGRRYAPYAFTEHGVTMLAAVLQSPRAVLVSIEVVRAFVRLRAMLAGNAELARKLTALEKRYDAQFKVVFDAIRELMAPEEPARSLLWFPDSNAKKTLDDEVAIPAEARRGADVASDSSRLAQDGKCAGSPQCRICARRRARAAKVWRGP